MWDLWVLILVTGDWDVGLTRDTTGLLCLVEDLLSSAPVIKKDYQLDCKCDLIEASSTIITSRNATEKAVGVLASAQDFTETDEYQRLRNALLERGAIES